MAMRLHHGDAGLAPGGWRCVRSRTETTEFEGIRHESVQADQSSTAHDRHQISAELTTAYRENLDLGAATGRAAVKPVVVRQTAESANRFVMLVILGVLTAAHNQSYASSLDETVNSAQVSSVADQRGAQAEQDPMEQSESEPEDAQVLEIEEIVVTGSNIRGVGFGASSGVVISKQDIELSGYSTVDQLIESLPQNYGGGAAGDTFATLPGSREAGFNTSGASSAVNLRGLGASSTLTLVNGRRVVPSGLGAFVDLSILPLTAVDRVEVLTDGASAVYGADAVAGVVNFVLQNDYDGAETRVRYGSVTDGGREELRLSQAIGNNWSDGNVLFSYQHLDQSALEARDRDFAIDAGAPETFDLLPEVEQHSIFTTVSQEVANDVILFAEGMYFTRDSLFTVFTPAAREVTGAAEQFSITAGIDYDLSEDWHFEFNGSYGEEDSGTDTLIVASNTTQSTDTENSLWTLDSSVDGSLFKIAGGDIAVAAGVHYRDETFKSGATDTVRFDRDVVAIYSELFIPLISNENASPFAERLEISVAGRFEEYSDFGSTADPKIGVLWGPTSDLNIRSTFSTSFKAPILRELNPDLLVGALVNVADPLADDGNTILLTVGGGSKGDLQPETSTNWTVGFDYTPSQVDGLTVSATYYDIEFEDRIAAPTALFTDLIARQDIFAPVLTFDPTQQQIDDFLALTPVFLNFTEFFGPLADFSDAEVLGDGSIQNLAITNTDGIDLSVDYSFDSEVGDFNVGLIGNYIISFEEAITTEAPLVETAGTVFNPADLRIRAYASWRNAGLSAAAFDNHIGGYVDNLVSPNADIDSWTTVDLQFSYDTGQNFGDRFLSGVRLSISLQNVFDEDPPFISGPPATSTAVNAGFDPANASPLGRFIAVELTKTW